MSSVSWLSPGYRLISPIYWNSGHTLHRGNILLLLSRERIFEYCQFIVLA